MGSLSARRSSLLTDLVGVALVLWLAAACTVGSEDHASAQADTDRAGGAVTAGLRPDETVLFFRTRARVAPGTAGERWLVPVHAWVYEAEDDSVWRGAALATLREQLGLEPGAEENARFRRRAGGFLADSERAKTLRVTLGGGVHPLPATGADGHTRALLEVEPPPSSADDAASAELAPVVVAPDGRRFRGLVLPASPTGSNGVTVVSDIDDTVKRSDVTRRRELLRNTFLREFEAVEGLAERYAEWAAQGAAFEYLSSSPWQLYTPLSAFLDNTGYPPGPLHLKAFRVKDERFFALFEAPEAHKTPVLEALLAERPGDRFVLVGDSGERDPELYAALARDHPQRVARILIRELPEAPMDEARRAAAFAGLAGDRVLVFRDAVELPARPW